MPSGDSFQRFQQNLALVHNFTSVAPVMRLVYLYSASKCSERVLTHGINKLRCLNKGTDGNEVLSVGEWHLRGMFEITSLLKSITLEQGMVFSLHFPKGASVRTPVPLSRLRPIVLHGVRTQAGPPSVFVTHCSPLCCDRAHFTAAALGHLALQQRPPVSVECSCTELGSLICPFVVCISCSTSCDVTD